jgi:hypothetical protein
VDDLLFMEVAKSWNDLNGPEQYLILFNCLFAISDLRLP